MSQAFILASASPRRMELLTQIGVKPDSIIPANIDETPLSKELPKSYALRIAIEKARLIAENQPENTSVLAADTVVALGRRILPKAENNTMVESCLKQLSGRRHRVYTAIALHYKGKTHSSIVMTTVKFKRLNTQDFEHYLLSNEGIGKAGGYAIQGIASAFIPSINGSYSNVVGLPLYETANLLKGNGII